MKLVIPDLSNPESLRFSAYREVRVVIALRAKIPHPANRWRPQRKGILPTVQLHWIFSLGLPSQIRRLAEAVNNVPRFSEDWAVLHQVELAAAVDSPGKYNTLKRLIVAEYGNEVREAFGEIHSGTLFRQFLEKFEGRVTVKPILRGMPRNGELRQTPIWCMSDRQCSHGQRRAGGGGGTEGSWTAAGLGHLRRVVAAACDQAIPCFSQATAEGFVTVGEARQMQSEPGLLAAAEARAEAVLLSAGAVLGGQEEEDKWLV